MHSIKGFLIDLDGVLYVENKVIEGAVDAVNFLQAHPFECRFLTNTTMLSRKALLKKLTHFGFTARELDIFNTCVVAAHWLKLQNVKRLHLLLPKEAQADFSEFEITTENPEAVVVGDLGRGFNFDVLNQAFRLIKNGARLIGLQKNRFWQTLEGLSLDVGAFVAALEYASETEATIIGKPNRAYFEMAVQDMGVPEQEIVMIGDDIFTDIKGANAVGLKSLLVKTGKYQFDSIETVDFKPDWILNSIADLPQWLAKRI
ncbi:MAG: TIGR01458 family HAD-type hydrolase [bacterium]